MLSPGQELHLPKALLEGNVADSIQDLLQSELLEACRQAYKNCTAWESKWQVLSIVTSTCSLFDIQWHEPAITPYLCQAAVKHASEYVKGVTVPSTPYLREGINQSELVGNSHQMRWQQR